MGDILCQSRVRVAHRPGCDSRADSWAQHPVIGSYIGSRRKSPVEDTFDISEASGSGNTILSVAGELDIATAPELRDRLEAADRPSPAGSRHSGSAQRHLH